MSRFNTGNPLGSGDPRDLDDNAKNMDLAVNSDELRWSDRFGRDRKSFEGMEREFDSAQTYRENEFDSAQNSREARFNDFIAASGYQFLGDYGPGIELTEYNQLIRDSNGEFWRVSGQVELPYVTTGAGIPEDDALVPAGDAVLRQDLSMPAMGASLVQTIQSGPDAVPFSVQDKLRRVEYSVADTGASPSNTPAQNTLAIQRAIDYCAANGIKCVAKGALQVAGKIVIKGAFDGSKATWTWADNPPVALEVSTGIGENPTTILNLTEEDEIILPSIKSGKADGGGWVGYGVGVRYVNVQNCKITERLVAGFDIGVLHTAYSQGCGYCTVQVGYLRNNKVNRRFSVGNATGWTNRWDLYGGRYFHASAEGIAVPGVKHIQIDAGAANIINDINHFGGSLEGVAEEYVLDIGGVYCTFIGCRFENSTGGGSVPVRFRYAGTSGEGSNNVIAYGRGIDRIAPVTDSGTGGNQIIGGRTGSRRSASGVVETLKNRTADTQPVMVALSAAQNEFEANPLTEYAGFFGPNKIGGKRPADAFDRVLLDLLNGRLVFGNGTAEPDVYFSRTTGGANAVTLREIDGSGAGLELVEMSALSTPVAGRARLYLRDNGSGGQLLEVRWDDGSASVLAAQGTP